MYRLKGGIEPLRLSSATGLKPALRTTEGHQGEKRVSIRVAIFVENITGRYLWLVVKPHLISLLTRLEQSMRSAPQKYLLLSCCAVDRLSQDANYFRVKLTFSTTY